MYLSHWAYYAVRIHGFCGRSLLIHYVDHIYSWSSSPLFLSFCLNSFLYILCKVFIARFDVLLLWIILWMLCMNVVAVHSPVLLSIFKHSQTIQKLMKMHSTHVVRFKWMPTDTHIRIRTRNIERAVNRRIWARKLNKTTTPNIMILDYAHLNVKYSIHAAAIHLHIFP